LLKPAVIVVNSHVARGGVGGRASVFALERMGFPVWSVPTVVLPWHLGHGRASRVAPDAAGFAGIMADLSGAGWLGEVGGVLSGYFGTADQVGPVAALVAATKARNPAARFLCDPILGDSGDLFQPEPMVEAICDRLIPLADIATPNRHELGWLTGLSIQDNDAIIAAARRLGPDEVVVTSAFAPPGEIGMLAVTGDGAHLATHVELADVPHGTGDLFAALYLGHRLQEREPPVALQRAASSVLALIEMAARLKADELPLAAGQDVFLALAHGVTITRL
jgi:pyridoxine kinase